MMIPEEYLNKIGGPQKLSRTIELDGLELLLRLQKPFEEPPEDLGLPLNFELDEENNLISFDMVFQDPEDWMEFGTCLIVEAWSEATQSVITQGIRKAEHQTDEEFTFGVRYMLNRGTDEEWIEVIKNRKLDKILKVACNNEAALYQEPKVTDKKEDKK